MIDAVLTHPHHPDLCGVVKFSQRLAAQLGVPCRAIGGREDSGHPLFSIKGSELDSSWWGQLGCHYDVFLHDHDPDLNWFVLGADRVYAANRVIAAQLREIRPDVIPAWCPSLIAGDPTRKTYNVLTFGMAHKLQIAQYERLKATLDAEYGDDYTVNVSTAVHEGSPWDSTAEVADKLRAIFGANLRVLGYLADDALVREIEACDAIALYFPEGVRENNTTWHTAVNSGKRVFTNYDALSPTSTHGYTWDRLKELLCA